MGRSINFAHWFRSTPANEKNAARGVLFRGLKFPDADEEEKFGVDRIATVLGDSSLLQQTRRRGNAEYDEEASGRAAYAVAGLD